MLLPSYDGKISSLLMLMMFRNKLAVEYFQVLSSMCLRTMIWVGNLEAGIF